MDLLESVADDLARQALEVIGMSQDDKLIKDMAEVMGASSSTLQEAFLTAVRIRKAETRALHTLKEFKAKQKA